MADESAPSPQESTASMMAAYSQHLPEILRVTSENIYPYEQAKLAASQAVSPEYTKLQKDLYAQYGPALAEIGSQINRQNELAQIATDTEGMARANESLLPQVIAGMEQIDPGARAAREASANKLTQLMGSLDPTGLSGSERAEVERSLARSNAATGNTTPSNLTTVGNAMTFGNALQGKQANIASALAQASQVMPTLKSGVDPFQVATGRSSSVNTGIPQFLGNTQTGQDTKDIGGDMFAQIGENTRKGMDINADRRDIMDRVMQGVSGIGSLGGAACCWIFMEAYNGTMPWWVRKCRDAFYTPSRREGYRLCAKLFVPLMQRYDFIRNLINDILIIPLTSYGGYLYKVEGYEDGRKYEGYTKFWFRLWDTLGRIYAKKK